MLNVQRDLPDDAVRPGGGAGEDPAEGPRDPADIFFYGNARELGYFADDPHEPGRGRGVSAYYRDHGMTPPLYLEINVRRHEITGLDLERLA